MPVAGVKVGTAAAGIGRRQRDDLTLFELSSGSTCAGVFTSNQFCAAPVLLARRHLGSRPPRYLLVNAGNANAGTGAAGLQDALACCSMVARETGSEAEEVLPFSTGVIGERLPLARFESAIPSAVATLSDGGWNAAARAIMTTDTVPKGLSVQVCHQGLACTVTGIVKGSGMIRPDMATMLAFIATDASAPAEWLQHTLAAAVRDSFNRVTVDGDTSTNDACVLVATGRSGFGVVDDDAGQVLADAVREVCGWLACSLVRDAEGATKFVTVKVEGGADEDECLAVAYAVAHSPLVKTALFASDPNWGRILAAVGRAGVSSLDVGGVGILLGDVCIVRGGSRADDYTEEAGQRVMDQEEIDLTIDLGRGRARTTVWTCDLSHEYVRINAEYRS